MDKVFSCELLRKNCELIEVTIQNYNKLKLLTTFSFILHFSLITPAKYINNVNLI